MEQPNDDPEDREAGRDRPPPARRRGPQRALSEEAARFVSRTAVTDRRGRFERRREQVAEIRRARRRRQLLASVVAATTTVGVAVGVGAVVAGTVGASIGLGGAVVVGVVALAVRWAAQRRGASAWDWTTQSHRLFGDPSDRVRARDRHDDRIGADRSWWR